MGQAILQVAGECAYSPALVTHAHADKLVHIVLMLSYKGCFTCVVGIWLGDVVSSSEEKEGRRSSMNEL